LNSSYIQVDGNSRSISYGFDISPTLIDGHLLIPVCAVVEEIGGDITFGNDQQQVFIKEAHQALELKIDSREMLVNGSMVYLDAPVQFIDNAIMVPVAVLSEGLNFEYLWDDESHQLILLRMFQTRRLIVRTENQMDLSDFGASEVINGPDNLIVMQFETIAQAKNAHSNMESLSYVILAMLVYTHYLYRQSR